MTEKPKGLSTIMRETKRTILSFVFLLQPFDPSVLQPFS
jgi:hypothetical protein